MSTPQEKGTRPPELKVVGKSGQIALGKSYAGKTLSVTRQDDGTVVLTPVVVIPESQAWIFQEPHWTKLKEGLAWAAGEPAKETDLDAFLERVLAERRRARSK